MADPQDPQLRQALACAKDLLTPAAALVNGDVVDPLRLASLLLAVHVQLHALVKRIEQSEPRQE